jgi:peroxiredoxin
MVGKAQKLRSNRLFRGSLRVLLLVVFVMALHVYQTRGLAKCQAPDFEGLLLDGRYTSLQAYRGQPVLLQFWATWCRICAMEQAAIHRLAKDHAVLSIALDDAPPEQILNWMEGKGVSYAVVSDPEGHISQLFGVRGVPTSVIVDAAGEIRFVEVGYTTEAGLRLRLWWAGI